MAPARLNEAELGNSSYFFSQLTLKSRAYLWRSRDILMHYLMFKLGEASVTPDIWLSVITAEIRLHAAEIGLSCHLAWWLKPTAGIWKL